MAAIAAVSIVIVVCFPFVGDIATNIATGTAPIVCGVLIGTVSVLATVLMVIYPALDDRKLALGSKYVRIRNLIPDLYSEIKNNTIISVIITALVLVLSASKEIPVLAFFKEHWSIVSFLYSGAMVFASIVLFASALDVVKAMFTLFAVVHEVYGYEKDTNRPPPKNTPAP